MRKEVSGKQQAAGGRTVIIERAGRPSVSLRVPSAADWDVLASELAGSLKPGDILALSGPLGAGKTTFVQALARALGIKRIPQSPTFSLMRSYELPRAVHGIKRLLHVDAYRIEQASDLLALDLDEELSGGETVLVIEWPEKVKKWLSTKSAIRLTIVNYGNI
jgi:tRNA threonylcarbamoyladenosine biosynthesis protein TsaE